MTVLSRRMWENKEFPSGTPETCLRAGCQEDKVKFQYTLWNKPLPSVSHAQHKLWTKIEYKGLTQTEKGKGMSLQLCRNNAKRWDKH